MWGKEQLHFTELGINLGRVIEQRLGVPHAIFVQPQDLAMIGLVVFGETGQDYKCGYLNVKNHARNAASIYREDALQKYGVTRLQLEKVYPALTGNGDFSHGLVADALRKADKTLNKTEFEELQYLMAYLMASLAKLKPDIIEEPNVRLDSITGKIKFARGLEYKLTSQPTTVVEYGPGSVALRKISAEVSQTPQTIFIEKNYYLNELLFQAAILHGINYPQIVTRKDGIESATAEMIMQGIGSQIDIIIMSMVHSAGELEIQAGIENGHNLLKPNGILVVQAVEQVQQGEAPANFIKKIVEAKFSQVPVVYREYKYTDPIRKVSRDVFQAVYVKQ